MVFQLLDFHTNPFQQVRRQLLVNYFFLVRVHQLAEYLVGNKHEKLVNQIGTRTKAVENLYVRYPPAAFHLVLHPGERMVVRRDVRYHGFFVWPVRIHVCFAPKHTENWNKHVYRVDYRGTHTHIDRKKLW